MPSKSVPQTAAVPANFSSSSKTAGTHAQSSKKAAAVEGDAKSAGFHKRDNYPTVIQKIAADTLAKMIDSVNSATDIFKCITFFNWVCRNITDHKAIFSYKVFKRATGFDINAFIQEAIDATKEEITIIMQPVTVKETFRLVRDKVITMFILNKLVEQGLDKLNLDELKWL